MELFANYFGDEIQADFRRTRGRDYDTEPELVLVKILGVEIDPSVLPEELQKELLDLHHYVDEWKGNW